MDKNYSFINYNFKPNSNNNIEVRVIEILSRKSV